MTSSGIYSDDDKQTTGNKELWRPVGSKPLDQYYQGELVECAFTPNTEIWHAAIIEFGWKNGIIELVLQETGQTRRYELGSFTEEEIQKCIRVRQDIQ